MSEAEVRESSVELLQSYLTSIIESIVGSVDQCPPVMRVAFKQLHKRVEEQFAEPENEVGLEQNICICASYVFEIHPNFTDFFYSYLFILREAAHR